MWFVRSQGISRLNSISTVFLDRVIGLISLVLFVILLVPFIYMSLGTCLLLYLSLFLAGISILGIAAFFLLEYLPESLKQTHLLHKILNLKRHMFCETYSKSYYLSVFVLSVAAYVAHSALVYFISSGLQLPLSFFNCLLFVPPVILIMSYPISLGGWGVREGAMVIALSSYQIATEKAFLLSILFGLLLTAGSLPGGLLWLLSRQEGHRFNFSSIKKYWVKNGDAV
jgi:glycosyltransferase 2 family protein